jgi:hypothetical protein
MDASSTTHSSLGDGQGWLSFATSTKCREEGIGGDGGNPLEDAGGGRARGEAPYREGGPSRSATQSSKQIASI